MTMRKVLTTLCALWCVAAIALAQEQTSRLTMYNAFKPAIIHLATGKNITHPLANISLKDAALLYLQGTYTMQANMDNVVGVDINGQSYIKIDKKLALCLDTIGSSRLFCTTIIDVPAYEQMLKNNRNITSMSLFESDVAAFSTIDLESEDERQLPVIRIYHYLYNGKMIRVHEREIWNKLPKDKRHMYRSIVSLPDFSWTSRSSLVQLLRAITD